MKKVYLVYSVMQDDHMLFSSEKKAKKWVEKWNEDNNPAVKQIFDKSNKDDLYILARIVF